MLTANIDDRTITGLMLPYGDPGGRTNLGRVVASAGSVSVPEDPSSVVLNLEHERKAPIGKAVSITEEPDGLHATFRVARTRAGDDLLAEVAEGLRTGLSVEVDNPIIRAGKILGGALTACAAVVAPAFPNALMTAADAGEIQDAAEHAQELADELQTIAADTRGEQEEPKATEATDKEKEAEMAENENEEQEQLAASAPAGGVATLRGKGGLQVKDADSLFASLAKAHETGDRQMLAALDNVIQSDAISSQQPTWAGEIWSSRTHRQKFLPLFTRKPLTSLKITGWEFDTLTSGDPATPTVDSYSGFPNQPNSTEVKTKAVTITASRLAGANAIDRAFVDFSTPDFWSGYYRESANDLSRKLDGAALSHMLTAANYTEVEAGTVPTDVATALSYIVDGVLAIQDIAVPDFAVVGTDLWRTLALTKKSDAVEYLSVAVGLDPAEGRLDQFTIVPSGDAALTGKVLVGASEAHTAYGEKSVRVDTVNIGTGGVETGVFAYYALHTGNAGAFAMVAPAEG